MSKKKRNTKPQELLKSSADIIDERGKAYGDAGDLFETVASYWNTYLGKRSIEAKDVPIMMALLKIARQAGQPLHEDNYTDAAAYIALAFGCHLKNAPEIKADVL